LTSFLSYSDPEPAAMHLLLFLISSLTLLVVPRADAAVLAKYKRETSKVAPVPASAQSSPLWSCKNLAPVDVASGQRWEQKFQEAAESLCKDTENWPLMEVFLDSRFTKQYERFYNAGWVDRAWVNYVQADEKGNYWGKLTRRLVDSIHRQSSFPIIVVNFGQQAIPEVYEPELFPHMILLHARALPEESSTRPVVSFNFNKLRAAILAHAKVGASLDSDMMMVGPQADQLLSRTAEEITEAYPFPMMPTHFLSRDFRDAGRLQGSNYLYFNCKGCPKPTMRWGQAQPTWTYWSLPFLARWLSAKLGGHSEQGVPTEEIEEDEDLLNVALWREGASKAWCAYQMGGVSFLWENYFPEHAPGPSPYYNDPRFFPAGVPLGFFFSHAEKEVGKVDKALAMIEEHHHQRGKPPKAFFHNMKFYDTFAHLRTEHPHLNCTL